MKFLDFESRSRAKLRDIGRRNYWEHPSTEALCCVVYDNETDALNVWTPGNPAPYTAADTVVAHNWEGFDRFGAARYGWPAARAIDSAMCARRAGLPGGLDQLAQRLLGTTKDKTGNALTLSLSRPSRAKARLGRLPTVTRDIFTRVVEYCADDVGLMVDLCEGDESAGRVGLLDWAGDASDFENQVYAAHLAINDKGIGFDAELATALLRADESNAWRIAEDVGRTLGMTAERVIEIARSPAQFTEMTGEPNAQAETVAACTHPIARAREALATIAAGKFRAGVARQSPDGRLRDTQRYYGAHTGRWSGAGMQLQNLPRPSDAFEKLDDDAVCRLADAIKAGTAHPTQDEISGLVRSTLAAAPGKRLIARDYSGVEARGLAWAAGDDDAIDVFLSGRDVYKVMASEIFGDDYDSIGKGTKRSIGKIAELACGYGQGHKKFYENNAAALDAAGVSAVEVIRAWRSLHAPIVRFWDRLAKAFIAAAQGRVVRAGPYTFEPGHGSDVLCMLPSGRSIVYPEVKVGRGERGPDVSYMSRDRGRVRIYGGMIAENVTQAMCRDLLADAMVQAHDTFGDCLVLSVHDELVIEVDECAAQEADAELSNIFDNIPAWAEGFPVASAGFICRRYRK